jgi:hypothetical protein
MKTLVCWAAILLSTVASRAAEEATPEVVAKRQIEAMRSLNWELVARYTHPRALEQMQALFIPVVIAGAAAKENPAAQEMMKIVFAGKSADELSALAPAAFFEIVMNGISGATPDFKSAMTGMEIQILGSVKEGEDLAHVVYRLRRTIGDIVATKIATTTVERDGEMWKAQLNTDLENVARAISARLQRP